MPVRYVLMDLDKTIYPAESPLMGIIDRLMTDYVVEYLHVPAEEAERLRRESFPVYGTTLRWLLEERGLKDPEGYLAAIHPVNVAPHLIPDPGLRQALLDVGLPMSIITNSPTEHAHRVLDYYGIRDLFPQIFDLRFNGYRGKPAQDTYSKVMAAIGAQAATTLLVDDHPLYLHAFREMGGQTLLVSRTPDDGLDRIDRVNDLPDYLRRKA